MTLLRVFLVASGLIIALGGIVLSSVLTRPLSAQAIADNRASVSQYVDGVLRAERVQGNRLQVNRHVSARLPGELRRNRSLVTVKVWRPDGVLAWTNRVPQRIGKRFELDGDIAEALHDRGSGRPLPACCWRCGSPSRSSSAPPRARFAGRRASCSSAPAR